MRSLSEAADRETTVYFTGGASAVILGWRATTTLEDGLRAQWEWASVRVAAP